MSDAPEKNDDAASFDEDSSKKGNKKKLLLFILLPILLLIGGGAALFFTGILGGHKEEKTAETAALEEDFGTPVVEKEEQVSVFVEIPPMLVNLNTPEGQPRYLKLKIQLEVMGQENADKVTAILPRVVDQFQTYLRELRVKDLRGSSGLYRLQMELLSRVNDAAYPTEVKDVLFQEILLQ